MTTKYTYTANYKFALPKFDVRLWHGSMINNFKLLDTLIASIGGTVITGEWENNVSYSIGSRVFDPISSTIYLGLVAHTSAATDTFEADRTANPTYWEEISDIANWRGTATINTQYYAKDVVTLSDIYYQCNFTHISSDPVDFSDGNWTTVIDLSSTVTATNADAASASSSASSASIDASSASSSASTATTAQSACETIQTDVTTKASNAATSESNAASSETNAANSASAASTSETNAASSASAASTSETNAATSETNAETAKTAAEAAQLAAETAMPPFAISYVTGLQAALDAKLGLLSQAADSVLFNGLSSAQFLRADENDTIDGNLTVNGIINVGDDGDTDPAINFWDETNEVRRTIKWDDTTSTFRLEDSSGSFGQVWTATTDGTGSGLDADTVDGVEESKFSRLDTVRNYTADVRFSHSTSQPATDNAAGGVAVRSVLGQVHVSGDDTTALVLNRQGSDGQLINFRQGGNQEGTVTVSGSTVSYNGGHLARYSNILIADKDDIPNLLKGTVMSNVDELIDWRYVEYDFEIVPEEDEDEDAERVFVKRRVEYFGDEVDGESAEIIGCDGQTYIGTILTEKNEQLNFTKISNTLNDKNVTGVFIDWDVEEDCYGDFLVASVGDVIIRISKDTTVEMGDLLISNGDGTAVPQTDDIKRSSTIAKVNATARPITYADGSYCVPCMLIP